MMLVRHVHTRTPSQRSLLLSVPLIPPCGREATSSVFRESFTNYCGASQARVALLLGLDANHSFFPPLPFPSPCASPTHPSTRACQSTNNEQCHLHSVSGRLDLGTSVMSLLQGRLEHFAAGEQPRSRSISNRPHPQHAVGFGCPRDPAFRSISSVSRAAVASAAAAAGRRGCGWQRGRGTK